MMAQQDSLGSTVRHRFSASFSSYLTQFAGGAGSLGGGDQEMDVIMLDHCYSKPWSAHPDASNARPVRMLFMPKHTRPSTLEMLQRYFMTVCELLEAFYCALKLSVPSQLTHAHTVIASGLES